MRYKLLFTFIFITTLDFAQPPQPGKLLVSGPMIGHTAMRTAVIWTQFTDGVGKAEIRYSSISPQGQTMKVQMELNGGEFNTAEGVLTNLEPGNTYRYGIYANGNETAMVTGEVTTQSLWQWRGPAPDFEFITGSCAYFNETAYDRPGKPYGGDVSIFESMAKENSNFMLWLGDNWYTREADYFSDWGLYYRASHDRASPSLSALLKRMPQYAIWDDHDYGPNDSDKSYSLKSKSRDVFEKYWANPSTGLQSEGVFTKFTWNDVDFFLLDDRWWRSNDANPDSVNGLPNSSKMMFGPVQMEWLKNSLLTSSKNSSISFRIIVTGSQVLNAFSPYDCFRHFPTEYSDLMAFLDQSHIGGVLFLTGDRHHSEVIRQERKGLYPLYDITVSPLTSSPSKTRGKELSNPTRIGKEVDEQNYARFRFTGNGAERKLNITFIAATGATLSEWSIALKELRR